LHPASQTLPTALVIWFRNNLHLLQPRPLQYNARSPNQLWVSKHTKKVTAVAIRRQANS